MVVNNVLVDIGSSSVKVYVASGDGVFMKKIKTIFFKKNMLDGKLNIKDEEELLAFLKEVKEEFNSYNVKCFATSVFRKLDEGFGRDLIDKICNIGISFELISHEMENFYLGQILAGKFNSSEPLLLINIGGWFY